MIDLDRLIRDNIRALKPYSSARDEFSGTDGVFLDANENPYGTLNRYPDPYQRELKQIISENKGIDPSKIFIGNGSDEIIDLLFRIFCNPGSDKALTFSPTYGMYDVAAGINDVELIKLELDAEFDIDFEKLKPRLNDKNLKLIIVCSPNNPTGNCMNPIIVEKILREFRGILIIDEAYIDFSHANSFLSLLDDFPNLIICQTLSKARGLAAVRIGLAFAKPEVISLLNKVKPPYNISALNQQAAIESFQNNELFDRNKRLILEAKENLKQELLAMDLVKKIFPSQANFFLVETANANLIYERLVALKIIVRNRNQVVRNCIRITVGTAEENKALIDSLRIIEA